MPRYGAATLRDVRDNFLTIACEVCGRRGRYGVIRLIGKHGDARLSDVLTLLTASCPKRASLSASDRCRAAFDWPNGPPTARER
jgi:hypothetical protein